MPGAAMNSSGDLDLRVWKCGEVGYLRKTGGLWLGCRPKPYSLSPNPKPQPLNIPAQGSYTRIGVQSTRV